MDFWPEFLASSWGKEFVAGGFGGIAGVISGYPLDSIRGREQNSKSGSAFSVFRHVVATEGPLSLYRGMAAPLTLVAFQNAMVFQSYAILSWTFDRNIPASDPPLIERSGFGGHWSRSNTEPNYQPCGIGEKLQSKTHQQNNQTTSLKGPTDVTRRRIKQEGWRGIYRGFTINVLRDSHSHGLYFWIYEYTKEQFTLAVSRTAKRVFKQRS